MKGAVARETKTIKESEGHTRAETHTAAPKFPRWHAAPAAGRKIHVCLTVQNL